MRVMPARSSFGSLSSYSSRSNRIISSPRFLGRDNNVHIPYRSRSNLTLLSYRITRSPRLLEKGNNSYIPSPQVKY